MCRLECENLSNQHDFMKKYAFLFIDILFLDLNRFGRVYFKRFFLAFAAFVYYLREPYQLLIDIINIMNRI